MDLLIEGTDSWGDSLRGIAAGVLQDIAKQLVQILVVEQAIRAIRGVVGGLLPGGGAGASSLGSTASNLAQYAPLPSFAGGGFTGTGARSGGLDGQGGFMAMLHPRESVIDHARPGAMRGTSGTTTNVVINVDASGTKASGDPGAGNALARDLAAVVDARLLHHKRPGGLLA